MIFRGHIDQNILAEADTLGRINHQLIAHIKARAFLLIDRFCGHHVPTIGPHIREVKGAIGHHGFRHARPMCARSKIFVKDGFQQIVLKISGPNLGGRLQDFMAEDDGLVAHIEGGNTGRLPIGRFDLHHLVQGHGAINLHP